MVLLPILAIVILTAIDQGIKLLVFNNLKPIGSVEIIKNFFYLTYVENTGAAFGFMSGARWFFILITIAILVAGSVYYIKMAKNKYTSLMRIALVLIGGGAIGNLIDRAFRGYVVDMFHFIFWGRDFAVFNFADALVVCGTILFAGTIIFSTADDAKKEEN